VLRRVQHLVTLGAAIRTGFATGACRSTHGFKLAGFTFGLVFFIGFSVSLNFESTDQAHSNAALLTLETSPDCLLTLLATNQLAQTRASQMYSVR